MAHFDRRRSLLVVLLPLVGLACPGGDDGPADGTDSVLDSSSDASSTGMNTIATSTTTVGTTPTTVADTSDVTTATTTVATTPLDTGETEMVPVCLGTERGGAGIGDTCAANDECLSGVCTIFSDAPLDPEATCDETPDDCSMRITARAIDIVTGQTPPGIDVVITSALQAATNPTGATVLGSATTKDGGRIDLVLAEPPMEAIGLVALLSGPSYELTATGVAAPADGTSYKVANDAHDLWLVSTNAVNAWSNMLSLDASIPADTLPLVVAGGVVGLVRDADGVPLPGATVASTNGSSDAIIRYLASDGTFNTTGTGDLGLFVILQPALAEVFEAEIDGMAIGDATAGSADGVVFTVVFTAP